MSATDEKATTFYDRVPNWVIAALFVFAGAIGVLAFVLRDTSPDMGDERGAKSACREFSQQRLKSPGSAQFSNEVATQGAQGAWTVSGMVDSENSFGGSVRNSYTCSVEYSETRESWQRQGYSMTSN